MGAMNSCCIPRTESDMITSKSTPKEKGHRRNLSATFNLSIIENTNTESNLVNINTATEEELMTLPGVNRKIAKSMVDYRNYIGQFRKVEDLALAPGVGASKLAMILNEIYVDSPTIDETDEGKQSSSLRNERTPESPPAVSINSANIFSLLKVKGVGMTVAKNIVAYREKYGLYKTLDELLKVKGITQHCLESMRPFLTTEVKNPTVSKTDDAKNSCVNGTPKSKLPEQAAVDQEYFLRSTASLENLLQILGPLAKVPERPKVEKVTLQYMNQPVFRLALWNLDCFTVEKAKNPGVKDVVCRTVLENGFGLVVVQDLEDREALQEICMELNSPTLPNVRKWTGKRGQWSCVVSETAVKGKKYQGFLYDKSQYIELIKSDMLVSKNTTLFGLPFLGIFKIKEGLHFGLISVHLESTEPVSDCLEIPENRVDRICDIVNGAKEAVGVNENLMIVGDFSTAAVLDELQAEKYVQCVPPEKNTNTSPESGVRHGSIWIRKEAQCIYTGVSGVVTDGLSSTWIPSGWSWGGLVSSYCPVYAQLYASNSLECDTSQRVAFY